MGDNYVDIELIDRFLRDDLDGEEQTAFSKRLEVDPLFRELLNDERDIRKGIEYGTLRQMADELRSLEATIAGVEENARESDRPRALWNTVGFKIAASLLLVAIVSSTIFIVTKDRRPDTALVFQNYFDPYPNEFFVRKRGDPEPYTDKQWAFYYYDAADYGKALRYFEQISGQEQDDIVAFYKANAWLALHDVGQAKNEFIKIRDKAGILQLPSRWYLSLCYLRLGELAEAKSILEKIEQENNSYSKRASALLSEINF